MWHRYGFQGQEKEDEITSTSGSHSFFKYRISDNRIGRFWSVDPLTAKYPHNSPYAFSENRLIDGIEIEGLEVATFSGGGRAIISSPNAPGISVSTASSIVFDLNENRVGFQVSFGFGPGYGAGAGAGIGIGLFPTVDRPSDIENLGAEVGLFAGDVFKFDISYRNAQTFDENGNLSDIKNGVDLNIGLGAGVGLYAEEQKTLGVEGDYLDLGIMAASGITGLINLGIAALYTKNVLYPAYKEATKNINNENSIAPIKQLNENDLFKTDVTPSDNTSFYKSVLIDDNNKKEDNSSSKNAVITQGS